MKPRHWLFLFLAAVTAVRFWCLGQIELTPGEAYHTLWSQHPDWCYYDKGPVVAMAIRAGTELFGINEFGVRFFSPLLVLGTSLLLYVLARRLYGETVAAWTVAALNVLPSFQSGGVTMTTGAISVFFWTAAILVFWFAIERGPGFNFYWPAAGLFTGAAFLTDYTGAVALASMCLVLASTGKLRREFARPGIWILLFFFIPFTIPVFLWNVRHEWITLLSWRGQFGAAGIHLSATLKFIADCALGCSPLIFAGIIIAAVRGFKKARSQFKPRFLLLLALPLIGLEIFLSAGKSASVNSSMPAFAGLLILSSALLCEATGASKLEKLFAMIALCTGLGHSIYMTGSLLNQPESGQQSGAIRQWKTIAAEIGALRGKFERDSGKPVFLIGSDDRVASILSFYLPDKRLEGPGHPPVYIPESQMIENQFSYWPRYDEYVAAPKEAQHSDSYYTEEDGVNPFMGRTAFFISDQESGELPTSISNSFEKTEPVARWTMDRSGREPGGIRVFVCYNYRGLPL